MESHQVGHLTNITYDTAAARGESLFDGAKLNGLR